MDEFFDEMQRLRDAVEHKQMYDTASTDAWNTLTSSMDALEDTHHAISRASSMPAMERSKSASLINSTKVGYGLT
jgi:hypothetical protein